jgi:hypothetical protein
MPNKIEWDFPPPAERSFDDDGLGRLRRRSEVDDDRWDETVRQAAEPVPCGMLPELKN